MDIEEIALLVEDNHDEICKFVDKAFEEKKSELKTKLINAIHESIDAGMARYIQDEVNPLKIDEDGKMSFDITVDDFFKEQAPVKISRAFAVETYGDIIGEDVLSWGQEILEAACIRYLRMHFDITDENIEEVVEVCSSFDYIRFDSVAGDFISAACAAEFVGISNVKLCDLELGVSGL